MDNGYNKIHTVNQKPSDKQIEVFHDYARRGLSNEIIALITGWRKPTVDKYVKENLMSLLHGTTSNHMQTSRWLKLRCI